MGFLLVFIICAESADLFDVFDFLVEVLDLSSMGGDGRCDFGVLTFWTYTNEAIRRDTRQLQTRDTLLVTYRFLILI